MAIRKALPVTFVSEEKDPLRQIAEQIACALYEKRHTPRLAFTQRFRNWQLRRNLSKKLFSESERQGISLEKAKQIATEVGLRTTKAIHEQLVHQYGEN